MTERLTYDSGIAGFDQTFGLPMREFVPTLLRLARISRGQRILDVGTGTGIAAEAALQLIGATGHVTAVDASRLMLDRARQRLAAYPNVTLGLENAEELSFPSGSFDAILCCMSLHIFNDEQRATNSFYRVLRENGTVAASVNTTADNSLTGRIRGFVAKHVPAKREEIAEWHERQYRLGEPDRLRRPFEIAGFRDIEIVSETRCFTFPSFEAYFDPIAGGGSPWGAEFAELPESVRQEIRDDLRREMEAKNESGQPVGIDVVILFASARK
jgi:ubiquinone/menaquinone biosynthesis C-methylase UbiE